jgi:hypothetical protein
MTLFSASVVEKIDLFRHADHISTCTRALSPDAYPQPTAPGGILKHQLDLNEALRLGEAALDSRIDDAAAGNFLAGAGGGLLIGALTVVGLIALYLFARKHINIDYRLDLRLSVLTLPFALFLVTPNCGDEADALPTDPPWEGEVTKAFVHPEQATLAILHGIVRPAMMDIGRKVDNLANIQNEVALPMTEPTPGSAYALKMYGLDGWGRRLNLAYRDEPFDDTTRRSYTVTSFGPDGEIGTTDDIVTTFKETISKTFGASPCPIFYILKDKDAAELLYHRWNSDKFSFNDKERARALSGSLLFDIIDRERLGDPQKRAIDTAYNAAAANSKADPVILQIFEVSGI